jgi:hypothetical protein
VNNNATIAEIIDEYMYVLAANFAKSYKENGKNFIACFLEYKSIRMACGFIRASCRKHWHEFETDKDFTDYCSRFNLSDMDKRLLNDTLKIIYVTLNGK